MQYGAICRDCKGKKNCKNPPTAHEPITDDEIGLIVTECPLDCVTDETWSVIELAGMYKKGLPPVSGGSLDQLQMFISACRLIWKDAAFWKAKFSFGLGSE